MKSNSIVSALLAAAYPSITLAQWDGFGGGDNNPWSGQSGWGGPPGGGGWGDNPTDFPSCAVSMLAACYISLLLICNCRILALHHGIRIRAITAMEAGATGAHVFAKTPAVSIT